MRRFLGGPASSRSRAARSTNNTGRWAPHVGLLVLLPLAATSASAQTFTTLFNFDGTHGATPDGGLTISGSTLYGMAGGGANGPDGTVFSIASTGGTPTVLYNFDGSHGASPSGDLTLRRCPTIDYRN
jgi:uncharacterized repeat protein (TIGR03803 family)